MSRQDLFDYVMNTPHNTNPAILKQKIKDISGASSWNDLKDKPFYVEENRTLVVEGVPDSEQGYYFDLNNQLEEGKEYTYIIDGIEYTGTAFWDDTDAALVVYLDCGGDYIAKVGLDYIQLNGFDATVSHKIEILNVVVHKLDAKYLPDPFWIEEKRTLVVEGVPDNGNYNVQTTLVEGEEYTYIIDGVEYTGKCFYDEPDRCVYLPDSMNTVAIVYEYGISMRKEEDQDVFHKIERAEKVYHTHHDFMIIYKVNDDTGERDEAKIVVGDYATAKAKILKGLQATAYVCGTWYGDGWQEIGNYIYELYYGQEDGDEYLALCDWDLAIHPDNTID